MAWPAPPALTSAPPMGQPQPPAYRWIKTTCGRAKYDDLAGRPGPWARLRLAWFVLIGGLRDWRLPQSNQSGDSSERMDGDGNASADSSGEVAP